MTPFIRISGSAYPLPYSNIDTDLIIPAEHLKTVQRSGLGRHAFQSLRATPGNVFDDPSYTGSQIIVALENFGCGSSREHAVWALADLGVRAVIAPSFSDIFAGNAFKNGIVTVVVSQDDAKALLHAAEKHDLSVDLDTMIITSSAGHRVAFDMDPFRRQCLLTGQDEIALTLSHEHAIRAYEQRMGSLP